MKNYFAKQEKILWLGSVFCIVLFFVLFDRGGVISLVASLVGVTSLIFNAKGNPLGQALMVLFSLIYGYISYTFSYYGEMLTYLGMTMPMSAAALIMWLKHPFNGNKSEVKVNKIKIFEYIFMAVIAAAVTTLFYYILRYFETANLVPSTVSVTTSFVAVYLTARRSPFFALAYAANDVVLIILWTLASFSDTKYISVTVCFAAFLVNDIYGFISWKKMEQRQNK